MLHYTVGINLNIHIKLNNKCVFEACLFTFLINLIILCNILHLQFHIIVREIIIIFNKVLVNSFTSMK